jgi:hypothetical protein
MAEGRMRHDWEWASHLLATLENCNRSEGAPTRPIERNPFYASRIEELRPEPVKEKDPFVIAALFGAKVDFQKRVKEKCQPQQSEPAAPSSSSSAKTPSSRKP